MAIDIAKEELLTLGQACRILPKKPSPATLWRWRNKGVRIGDRTIKLECVRVGRKWYTTDAAFARFLMDQTAAVSVDALLEPTKAKSLDEETKMNERLKRAGLIR